MANKKTRKGGMLSRLFNSTTGSHRSNSGSHRSNSGNRTYTFDRNGSITVRDENGSSMRVGSNRSRESTRHSSHRVHGNPSRRSRYINSKFIPRLSGIRERSKESSSSGRTNRMTTRDRLYKRPSSD